MNQPLSESPSTAAPPPLPDDEPPRDPPPAAPRALRFRRPGLSLLTFPGYLVALLPYTLQTRLTSGSVTRRVLSLAGPSVLEQSLVTLIGLIAKHGILIVEFANQLQEQGMDRFDAALASAKRRLRPILMTTGAMVLGAIPLALASGAGAEARHQIGWVIVGGMSFGTLLTLFVVPVVYSLIARRHVHAEPAPGEEPVAA